MSINVFLNLMLNFGKKSASFQIEKIFKTWKLFSSRYGTPLWLGKQNMKI
jgi:hypothetical protein